MPNIENDVQAKFVGLDPLETNPEETKVIGDPFTTVSAAVKFVVALASRVSVDPHE